MQRHPFFNTRDQLRLLGLVGLLLVVLIGVKSTSNPEFWAWMFPDEPTRRPQTIEHPGRSSAVDFTVRSDAADRLDDDAFRSPIPHERFPATTGAQPPRTKVDIDPAILEPVDDNYQGIRRSEAEAYYTVLARARDVPRGILSAAGRDDVAYAVLMTESDEYRGKPITIEGDVRRLYRIAAGTNVQGFDELYEGWLFTPDSGTNPYRVVCCDPPIDIPLGDGLIEPVRVRVTGYFFKRQGYQSQSGLHVAPLLLAGEIRRLQPTASTGKSARVALWPYITVIGTVIAAAVIAMLWFFSRGDRQFERQHKQRLMAASPEAIAALDGIEMSDPKRYLAELNETASGSTAVADDEPQNLA